MKTQKGKNKKISLIVPKDAPMITAPLSFEIKTMKKGQEPDAILTKNERPYLCFISNGSLMIAPLMGEEGEIIEIDVNRLIDQGVSYLNLKKKKEAA